MKDWALACTACGKCCNSAPRLSLPELFHHRERFVGCLTLRRFRKPRDDGDAVDPFWSRFFHPMGTSGYWLLLATHAYDDGTPRCPVLESDGRCGIQHDRKPAHCSAVPLDPLASIAEQARVLENRAKQAAFFGADCILSGDLAAPTTPRTLPLVSDGKLSSAARQSVEASRRQLELDRRFWGDAVYRLLPLDLLESSLVPSAGFLSISIVPVLMVIARVSEGCRQRCLGYLEAQVPAIEAALARLPAHAAHSQRQLSGFVENAVTLRQLLTTSPPAPSASSEREARAVERWLDTGTFHDAGSEARAAAYRAGDDYFALEPADMQRDAQVAILRMR